MTRQSRRRSYRWSHLDRAALEVEAQVGFLARGQDAVHDARHRPVGERHVGERHVLGRHGPRLRPRDRGDLGPVPEDVEQHVHLVNAVPHRGPAALGVPPAAPRHVEIRLVAEPRRCGRSRRAGGRAPRTRPGPSRAGRLTGAGDARPPAAAGSRAPAVGGRQRRTRPGRVASGRRRRSRIPIGPSGQLAPSTPTATTAARAPASWPGELGREALAWARRAPRARSPSGAMEPA